MSYQLRISRRVEKEIRQLHPLAQNRIDTAILQLENDPRPVNVEKLSGSINVWRIRVGDYRILYTIDDRSGIVDVLKVAHRRDVYRRR